MNDRDREKGLRRSISNSARLHRLGLQYRKQTPAGKRSYRAWLQFLKRHAPRLLGPHGANGGVQVLEASQAHRKARLAEAG